MNAPVFSLQKQRNEDIVEIKKSKKADIAKTTLIIAGTLSIAAGAGAAFRHKGGVKNSIKQGFKKLTQKLSQNKKSETRTIGKINMPDVGAGADNITNAKDSFARHFLLKIPGYEKFDRWSSNIYRKAISNTLSKQYIKAKNKFLDASKKLTNILDDATKNKKITKEEKEELLTLLAKKLQGIEKFTKATSFERRFNKVDNSMHRMDETGWEKLTLLLKGDKKEGIKNIAKESIVSERLNNAKNIHIAAMSPYKNGGLSQIENEKLNELVKLATKDGNEEIATLLKKADAKYAKIFSKEKEDLLLKLRDINCGSAPTDLESMAFTMGSLAIYTAQADTKDEKVGVTLTTGIPLTISLGATIFATCKLISGSKALGLGLGSGFIANLIGKFTNKQYQKHCGANEKAEKTIVDLEDFKEKITPDIVRRHLQ